MKLGEIVGIISGFAFDSKLFNEEGNGMPIVRIRNVGKTQSNTYYSGDYKDEYLLEDGDYLIGMDGDFRLAEWIGGKALLNQRVCKIIPNKKKLDKSYLYYFLPRELKRIEDKTSFATVKHLSVKKINEIEIPLPPLETQKRIAAILDKADELRRNDQKILEKYNQLAQSVFLEMFGDTDGEKVSFSDACEINPKKSEISKLDKNMQVSFIPMSNLSETGDVILSESRKIKEVWNGFTYFRENDVLFAKITPCMENGKGAIMRNLRNSYGFGSTEFHVLRPIKGKTIPEWIYYLTRMPFFRKQAEINMTGSAGQKRVPINFFKKYKIFIPDINSQIQFANIVSNINCQKQLTQQSLQKSEELFQSLLQKAFKEDL